MMLASLRPCSLAAAALAALLLAACGLQQAPMPSERLPRQEPLGGPPPRIALVLGSGGPRGFAHIGVLKVLEEAGIQPDFIVGSSVGAMVGVLYAGGYDARSLQDLAEGLDITRFLEFRELLHKPATGAPIQAFVNEKLRDRPLEALRMPVGVAATRLSDHRLVIFDRGDAGLAVRASAADPDNFAPVSIGGALYADGDELSPVPIRAARAMGARFVIAVDVSAYPQSAPAGVPQAWIDKDARRARQIRAEAPEANVMLHPDIGYYAGFDEKYRKRVMSIAEAYTRAKLPEIRSALAAANLPCKARHIAARRDEAAVRRSALVHALDHRAVEDAGARAAAAEGEDRPRQLLEELRETRDVLDGDVGGIHRQSFVAQLRLLGGLAQLRLRRLAGLVLLAVVDDAAKAARRERSHLLGRELRRDREVLGQVADRGAHGRLGINRTGRRRGNPRTAR